MNTRAETPKRCMGICGTRLAE